MPQAFLAAPRLPHLEPLPVAQKPPCALAALSFYDLPKLLFGTFASSSNASDFSCSTSPAAPRALACASEATVCLGPTLFLWPSETAFWHLQMLVRSRSAFSSNASDFSCSTSPAAPRALACASVATVPWPHSLFMTFRNCFLTPSNACKVPQRLLQQCLRLFLQHLACST